MNTAAIKAWLHTPKGKAIAVPKGSSAHGLLLQLLHRIGLEPTDVKLNYLAPADGLAAFSSGQVDAWSVWTLSSTSHMGSEPPASVSASSNARPTTRAVRLSVIPIGGRFGAGMARDDTLTSKR